MSPLPEWFVREWLEDYGLLLAQTTATRLTTDSRLYGFSALHVKPPPTPHKPPTPPDHA